MTLEHDPNLVPDDVTPEQIERAYDADPLPFPDDLEQDDAEDELVHGLLASPAPPNPPREALAIAKHYDDAGIDVGVGMCLKTVRTYFAVAALWPDAETEFAHGAPMHRPAVPGHAPRGSVGVARNGRHGHVWINLGAGLVRTTDYHRAGKVDVALESRMLAWCGALDHAWAETLNGVDVWPTRKRHKPQPPAMWTPSQRADFLKGEIRDALEGGHERKAAHLKVWRNRILDRIERTTP